MTVSVNVPAAAGVCTGTRPYTVIDWLLPVPVPETVFVPIVLPQTVVWALFW